MQSSTYAWKRSVRIVIKISAIFRVMFPDVLNFGLGSSSAENHARWNQCKCNPKSRNGGMMEWRSHGKAENYPKSLKMEWWNGGTAKNHLKSRLKDGMTERRKITPNLKRRSYKSRLRITREVNKGTVKVNKGTVKQNRSKRLMHLRKIASLPPPQKKGLHNNNLLLLLMHTALNLTICSLLMPWSIFAYFMKRRFSWSSSLNSFFITIFSLLFLATKTKRKDLRPVASSLSRNLSHSNCWFSHDVTKFSTSEILILLKFYFHAVWEQLKTNIHTYFHSEWVLGLVTDYPWISKLLRDVTFTWRMRELLCWFKRWLISGNSAIWTVLVLE